jgi:molecular chaperone GrpE
MSITQQETQAEPGEMGSESSTSVSDSADGAETMGVTDTTESTVEFPPEDQNLRRIAALDAELAAVREELSTINDKYLRKLAEDVNFRKRMTREKEDGQRFAVSALLGDLIPILDDFDRAIASAETQKDYSVLHDGVLLIKKQLGSVLQAKYGLARFESLGKPFDPNQHEAVAIAQGGLEDGDEAVVAEEFLPGYGLHDRILRTAKVRVRMPAPRGANVSDATAGAPEAKETPDKEGA